MTARRSSKLPPWRPNDGDPLTAVIARGRDVASSVVLAKHANVTVTLGAAIDLEDAPARSASRGAPGGKLVQRPPPRHAHAERNAALIAYDSRPAAADVPSFPRSGGPLVDGGEARHLARHDRRAPSIITKDGRLLYVALEAAAAARSASWSCSSVGANVNKLAFSRIWRVSPPSRRRSRV